MPFVIKCITLYVIVIVTIRSYNLYTILILESFPAMLEKIGRNVVF